MQRTGGTEAQCFSGMLCLRAHLPHACGVPGFPGCEEQPLCSICFTPSLGHSQHVLDGSQETGVCFCLPHPVRVAQTSSRSKPFRPVAPQQRQQAMDYPIISHGFRFNPARSAGGREEHRTRRQDASGMTLPQVWSCCQSQISGTRLGRGLMVQGAHPHSRLLTASDSGTILILPQDKSPV